MMNPSQIDRFGDLFEQEHYVLLKNYLYNYLLRKRAVEKNVHVGRSGQILEVGSGISPMITRSNNIVYSELSLTALRILRQYHGKGWYVVADATQLPFRAGVFDGTVCSEVLEHLPDDLQTLKELARVMKSSGQLIVTFPHRKAYFAYDDRFVRHFRRYELSEMTDRLNEAGLNLVSTRKVLGPLDKITMCFVLIGYSCVQKYKGRGSTQISPSKSLSLLRLIVQWANLFYAALAWLDARIMPRPLATILLITAKRNPKVPGKDRSIDDSHIHCH